MPLAGKTEKIHLRVIKTILFIIPVLPLYISSSIAYPFITGKNIAFRILVEVAAVFWFALTVVNRKYQTRTSLMAVSILLFTFIVGLADLFGVNPYNSFWSNYERMEGYITILHLALFFIIIQSIFKTERDWRIFFNILFMVSMLVSTFTLLEPVLIKQALNYIDEYGTRSAGTIGNPPFLASYLLFSVFIGLMLIVKTQKTYFKALYFIPVIINSIVLYITASRGAIIAAISGAIIIGFFFLKKHLTGSAVKISKSVAFILLGLVTSSSILLIIFNDTAFLRHDRTISRFVTMFSYPYSDTSINTRLKAWKMALNGIKENPVLGWGQENFPDINIVNPFPLGTPLIEVDRAHNIILDWIINAGVLGFFSYLMIFGSAFYILLNVRRNKIISGNEAIIISTAIIAYFIQNLFTFDTINTYMIFFSLMAYIDNIEPTSLAQTSTLPDICCNNNKIKSLYVFFIALTVFAAICYKINYIPLKQLQLSSQISLSLPKYRSFSKLLEDFSKALSYESFGDNYLRDQMFGVSNQIISYKLYGQEGALKLVQRSAEELEKGIATDPYDLERLTNAINYYTELAQSEPFFIKILEAHVEKCFRLNPEYERWKIFMIDIYFIKKEYDKAYDFIEKLVAVYPNSSSLQQKLALAAIFTSREEAATNALGNIKKNRTAENHNITPRDKDFLSVGEMYELAQAYMEVTNYHKAIYYYNEIILSLPDEEEFRSFSKEVKLGIEAGLHLEISKIYRQLGDKENSAKETEKAAKIRSEPMLKKSKSEAVE